jgi:hypothetical protein
VGTTVENVLLSFKWLFEALQSFGVKCVIVDLLPHREKVLPKRGLTMTEYNRRVDFLNEGLHQLSLKLYTNMMFWVHRGLQFPSVQILRGDGIHLNKEGNRRLLSSIRGALLYVQTYVNGKKLTIWYGEISESTGNRRIIYFSYDQNYFEGVNFHHHKGN